MANYDDDRRGRHHRGSYSYNLNVNDRGGGGGRSGRSRSRSSPNRIPDINIYNDVYADNDVRAQATQPTGRGQPQYPQQIPVMVPGAMPIGMGMPMGVPGTFPIVMPPQTRPRPPRHSSSSSSRSSHSRQRYNSDAWELQKMKDEKEREATIADFKRRQEREEEEKQHAIRQAELDREEHEKEKKEAAREAIRKYEVKKREEELENQRIAEEWERKKAEKAAAEKAAAEEYLRRKKEKEKKEEEEQKEATRKTLAKAGMTDKQIEAILNPKEAERGRGNALVIRPGGAVNPIYPKIRRADIALETLNHYKLQWMYDEADTDYLIILQEMTVRETDILFKHTAKVRERGGGTFMIEQGKDKNFNLVRRRSKSRGKSPGRVERVIVKGLFQ